MVTSARPDEGKSTISANLALALAFSGSRVLLIDGDLRRGRLHELLALKSEPSLQDLLKSTRPVGDFFQTSDTPHLQFLASGSGFEQPRELFEQAQFGVLLDTARSLFDYVIIDSSPVLAAADSCAIASRMDAVLFVMRARSTSLPLVRRAIELLQDHHAPLLGAVFNRFDPVAERYPFQHYGRYAATQTGSMVSVREPDRVAG
jgi:capsular exopolysaccharide synthesis family protein